MRNLADHTGNPQDSDDPRLANSRKVSAPLPFEWVRDVELVLDGSYLIEDLLPKSGPAVLYGDSGSGKTFFALELAAAVAMGGEWAGRHVEGGPVIYLCAEGQSGFRNRLAALVDADRISREAPFALISTAIDLQQTDGEGFERLLATTKEIAGKVGSPALIVIDTLSKTFGAGSENSDDMVSYVANCERIAEIFDCLTLIVHHRPKSGENRGERGHSSLRAGVAASILVESISGGTIRTATTKKLKDGPADQSISFRLTPVPLGTNQRGKEITTCLVDLIDGEAAPILSTKEQKRRRLTGHNQIALKAIEELIAAYGQDVPDSIPRDVLDRQKVWRVIPSGQVLDKLRAEFLGIVDSTEDKRADSAKRTASRAMKNLKAAEILGSWEEWIWIV